ncbi:alcohol acetyltransferase [Nostocales cyanobacterium LEGE 11386]|nr:alcohol acetyltransferase [Nostocales cyanobacterium LEGE 11386]
MREQKINNRNLGRLERVTENLNSRAKTGNIITISRIKGPLSAEILRPALDMIQRRHPRLNSRIVRSRNSLCFQTEGTAKIALRVVKKANEEQWQEVVSEEMNQEIDSSKCLLRAVLVHLQSNSHVNYLIVTGHHAVGDGLSSIQLHSEILTYCQQIVSDGMINPVGSLFPLPPVEELLPPWTQGLKGKIVSTLFFLQVALQKLWHRPQTLGFEKYAPIAQRRCDIIHRTLDQELTQQFIHRCRQEHTTVNSALCAAMMFTVASKVNKGNRKPIRLNCLSAIDLRKYLEPKINDHHMAVLASFIMGFHTIQTNKSFWGLAREVKQNLETSIKRGDIFKTILVTQQMMKVCFTYPKQVAGTVLLSNIGKVNIPKIYGEFELEEISFASSQSLYAGVLISHVSTFQGKMLLNFVFSEPSISRDSMEELVNSFMHRISQICKLKLERKLTNA